MKIVVAPNAFKESLTAWEAAKAIEAGLAKALPGARLVLVPMADGGDGTAETLAWAAGGRLVRAKVADPLGRPVRAAYALLDDGATAVVEMAAASGLGLLAPRERNPLRTSTRGTGQLIRAAVKRGARRLVIAIGGSATVDGGAGMAAALGYRFLDRRGRPVAPCGGALERIARIDPAPYRRWLSALGKAPELEVACDVTNPLLGERGAARVFGPQKGATPSQVERLESALAHLADLVRRDLGVNVRPLRGGGAAGGLGAGLVAFCGAKLRPGAELVMETVGLDEKLRGADWVVTGEGRIDAQTAFGKAPAAVARRARAAGARVIAVAGALGPGAERLRGTLFDALFSLCDGPVALDDALRRARPLLERLARSIGGLLAAAPQRTISKVRLRVHGP
jgi:glycerate kinase